MRLYRDEYREVFHPEYRINGLLASGRKVEEIADILEVDVRRLTKYMQEVGIKPSPAISRGTKPTDVSRIHPWRKHRST